MKCSRRVWYDDKLKMYHPADRWSSEENQICGGEIYNVSRYRDEPQPN